MDLARVSLSVLAQHYGRVSADDRVGIVRLVRKIGATDAVLTPMSFSGWRGKLATAADAIMRVVAEPDWADAETERIAGWADRGITFLTPDDAAWPAALNDLGEHAPLALWVRGTLPSLESGALSIVGSRDLSALGHSRIDRAVAGIDVPVISGLAVGADAAAHRAAILHGTPTVAVLPSGLDVPYPAVNTHLAGRIASEHGALIAEVSPGVGSARHRFLDRNRIIAALGTGSLIVEAGVISGTMNEARHAHALGRRLAAFPGTGGCDQLIASGLAYPIFSRTDVEALYSSDLAIS